MLNHRRADSSGERKREGKGKQSFRGAQKEGVESMAGCGLFFSTCRQSSGSAGRSHVQYCYHLTTREMGVAGYHPHRHLARLGSLEYA